jgi:hypothetical protein
LQDESNWRTTSREDIFSSQHLASLHGTYQNKILTCINIVQQARADSEFMCEGIG